MVRTLQRQDRNQKEGEQHHKKLHPIINNPSHQSDSNKENKDHSQQKIQIQLHHKKLEANTSSLRQTFVIYSKIHFVSLTKLHTVFLAFHLYEFAIADLTLKSVPQPYKALCCMYIAMKYEEIYPLQLREVAKYMRVNYNNKDYAQYQLMILKAKAFNLDVVTPNRVLQAYFQKLKFSRVEEMLSYFLLELAFASNKIYKQFNENDICYAILKMVNRSEWKGQQNEGENTKKLIKLILQSRTNTKGLQRHICHKYQSKKYQNVFHLPIKIL